MSTVASVDYVAKRIYLSSLTAGSALDLLDVYRDVRALRAVTPAHRNFQPMIVAGGNIQKTSTTFTQPYVQVLNGCYIVPYNAAGSVRIVREVFSDDGRAGLQCFDRSTVSANVDLDYDVQAVEVRTVSTSGVVGPTKEEIAAAVRADLAAELAKLTKIGLIHGVGAPLVYSPTSRVAGDLVQTFTTVGDTTTVSAV